MALSMQEEEKRMLLRELSEEKTAHFETQKEVASLKSQAQELDEELSREKEAEEILNEMIESSKRQCLNDTINGQKVKITQLEADVAQLEKVAEQEAQTKLEFEKLQKRNTEFKVLMDDLRNQKRNLQSQCDQKDLVLAKERENREREKRKEREEREVREEKEKEKRKEDERLQKERLEERAKDRCEIWKLRGLIEELKANVPLPSDGDLPRDENQSDKENEELKKSVVEKEQELGELVIENEELKRSLEEAGFGLEELESQKDEELDSLRASLVKQEKEVQEKNEEMKQLQRQLEEKTSKVLSQSSSAPSEILTDDVDELNMAIAQLTEETDSMASEIEQLKINRAALEEKNKSFQEMSDSLRSENTALQKEVRRLNEITEKKEEEEKLKEEEREKSEQKKDERSQKEIQDLNSRIQELEKAVQSKELEREILQHSLNALQAERERESQEKEQEGKNTQGGEDDQEKGDQETETETETETEKEKEKDENEEMNAKEEEIDLSRFNELIEQQKKEIKELEISLQDEKEERKKLVEKHRDDEVKMVAEWRRKFDDMSQVAEKSVSETINGLRERVNELEETHRSLREQLSDAKLKQLELEKRAERAEEGIRVRELEKENAVVVVEDEKESEEREKEREKEREELARLKGLLRIAEGEKDEITERAVHAEGRVLILGDEVDKLKHVLEDLRTKRDEKEDDGGDDEKVEKEDEQEGEKKRLLSSFGGVMRGSGDGDSGEFGRLRMILIKQSRDSRQQIENLENQLQEKENTNAHILKEKDELLEQMQKSHLTYASMLQQWRDYAAWVEQQAKYQLNEGQNEIQQLQAKLSEAISERDLKTSFASQLSSSLLLSVSSKLQSYTTDTLFPLLPSELIFSSDQQQANVLETLSSLLTPIFTQYDVNCPSDVLRSLDATFWELTRVFEAACKKLISQTQQSERLGAELKKREHVICLKSQEIEKAKEGMVELMELLELSHSLLANQQETRTEEYESEEWTHPSSGSDNISSSEEEIESDEESEAIKESESEISALRHLLMKRILSHVQRLARESPEVLPESIKKCTSIETLESLSCHELLSVFNPNHSGSVEF